MLVIKKLQESNEKNILEQITFHEQRIRYLRFNLKMMKEFPPQPVEWFKKGAPLTRDLVRRIMQKLTTPVRNVDLLGILYNKVEGEERRKLIKTLSVILNNLEKEGEIKAERTKGIKGNYYTWNKEK